MWAAGYRSSVSMKIFGMIDSRAALAYEGANRKDKV